MEIEDPGAANKVAEEGSLTIQTENEYKALKEKLENDRKNSEYYLGEGGFYIDLKDPAEF